MSIWPHFPSQWMQSGRFSSFPPKRAVEVDKTGKGWDIHGGHVMSAPRTGEAQFCRVSVGGCLLGRQALLRSLPWRPVVPGE